jgi:two-component system cell cycle sensor histidine kinase/response regulator CckA
MTSRKNSDNNPRKEESGRPHLLASPGDQTGRQLAGEVFETESLLHSILDQSPYPMWIADAQGTLIWLNQACRDLLHLTAAEVVGKYNVFQDNIVDQQGHLPLLRRVFEKGETVRFELTYDTSLLKTLQLQTAASVILDVTVSPVLDGNGKITHAVFQHVDITDRKRAEEELKKEKLFTEAILDSLPGTFFLLDSQGKHLRTNTSGQIHSGYSLEEVSNLHALDFVADEDRPAAQRALQEVFENGKVSVELQHLAKDGRKTPFLFSAKKFIIGDRPYILGTGMDITARKQSEEALRQSEKKYRSLYHEFQAILNAIPDTLSLISPDLRTVWCNEATSDCTPQHDLAETLGQPCFQLRHGKAEPCENCPVQRCFRSGRLETEENTAQGYDWELRAVPVYGDQGELLGAVELARNITARKRIENALQESEEQLRLALQAANQGFYDLNIQTGESKVSPEYATMLGYDPGNFQETSDRWMERLHPDDRERVVATYQAYIRGDIPNFAVEFRQRIESGEWKWILSLGKIAAWDEDGKPLRMLGTLTDITQRKNAEEALRESEKRLKEAQEMAHLGFWYWNVKTGEVTWSEEVYKIFQLDPKEFTPNIDSILELSPWPEDRQRDQELIRKAMESHEKGVYEQRFLLPDKSIGCYYSTFQGKYDEGGNLILIVGTVLDITERKQAEAALRESEQRFRSLVETTSDWFWEIDQNGRYTYASPKVRDLLGYQPDEVIGKSSFDFMPADEARQIKTLFQDLKESHESISGLENINLHKDGRQVVLETSGVPVFDQHGVFAGYRGIDRDITHRKQAEIALRNSERRLSEIIDFLPDATFAVDLEGKVIAWNRAIEEMTGISSEDMMGKGNYECTLPFYGIRRPALIDLLFVPDDEIEQKYAFVKKEGDMLLAETEVHLKGETQVFWAKARPLYDSEGKVVGAIETIRDITERKEAEKALRESEARFRQVVESSPLPIGIGNEDGSIDYVNPKFVETLGYTLEDLPRLEDWFRLAYPDPAYRQSLLSRWQKAWEKIKDTGVTEVEEVEIACKDGSQRIMQLFGTLMDNKSLVVFNDLTERKRMEETLRESEKKYRSLSLEFQGILNAVPDILCLLSPDLRIVWGNDATILMIPDKQQSEIIGEHCYPLRHKRSEPCENCPVLRCFSSGKIETEEVISFGDWYELRAVPLYDDQGELWGAIEVARNITERKRAEEERTRMEAQMREVQKLESLGVLAGGIAHDFNNLLMAILGNADLALLALSIASPARPHVEEISRGSLRAADLCRQMLAYSGKGRFVIGRYDLGEIVQEMAQMLKVSVSKKANLRYSFTAALPAVEVDATQMRQVIMNLIINASEAMEDQNGFISVVTGVMDCDRAFLAESYLDDNLPEGKYVYLEVADTGCGMDDDTRRRIFDPFFTTKFTGRGLGLAAVLGIVRGHQGAIKVYSEPGQGTTFKVLLPAVEWAPGDRPADALSTSQSLPGGTILLVDDDSHVRQVASQMLERLGFNVLTAAHGREGLEVFSAGPGGIACVILDLTMPEMAGDEVFRELRRLRKDVPVIISSGFNEQDVTQRFAGKGVSGFIQKPYTVKMLREILNLILEPK